MIRVKNTLIINGDTHEDFFMADYTGFFPLTCGLSSYCTVTASSMNDDYFTYCLQRSIFSLDGTEIPPQEFNVYWSKKQDDIFPYLALVTLLLLCGVSTALFPELKF